MNTRSLTCLLLGVVFAAPALAAEDPSRGAAAGPVVINGIPYEKQATREETERIMRDRLDASGVSWGGWYVLAPFPHARGKTPSLATPQGPEDEMDALKAGGPGLDLQRTFEGKNGVKAVWQPLGDISNRAINLGLFDTNELNTNAIAYLYTSVRVEQPTTIDVTMGSDDGLRFWLNGRLLIDKDVLRGVDPESDQARLDLKPGVNHILAKVSQVAGAFGYQINSRKPLDDFSDALLQYQLDIDFPASAEARYYRAISIPTPPDVVLEVGGLDVLPPGPDGFADPIVSTRRGDVYIVKGAYDDPPLNPRFIRFASGMHEPLGLAVRIEKDAAGAPVTAVYCVQRGELTRLVDLDGDNRADLYQTFSDAWGVSGNYHEFAFGPKFDRDGNAWVTLNVGFCGSLGKSLVPWRGWALKISPSGQMTPVASGLRSPNGIGEFDGAMFYLDNQGDYIGTNRMTQLVPGSWQGHPASLRWEPGRDPNSAKPVMQPATIWLPYKKMGQSGADILTAHPVGTTVNPAEPVPPQPAGKFGPFDGQIFIGDQTLAWVERIGLEKVDGHYQGFAIPFRRGLDCGVNRLAWGSDGSLFLGMTDRGWGSVGRKRYGIQRIVWTGKTPFELLTMRVKPDGFELTFTKDLDAAAAAKLESYRMKSYTYEYHEQYGSDEMETQDLTITAVQVTGPRSVRLRVQGLRSGGMAYVHELAMPGIASAAAGDQPSESLVHDTAYYTLYKLPKSE